MKTAIASPTAGSGTKTTFIGFRCPADLAETLKEKAGLERRSLSNFILFQLSSSAPRTQRARHGR